MSSLSDPPAKGRIFRAYHPAHGGPTPPVQTPQARPNAPRPNAPRPKADPAPSRWSYRMQRLMLTPMFRHMLRIGVPLAVTLLIGTIWLSDETRREALNSKLVDMRVAIEQRDEFMVHMMRVDGAGLGVSEDIREILAVDFPVSSFHLDLDQIRETIAGLDAVERISLRIKPGGVLQVNVVERVPAVVWRSGQGLELLDAQGFRVSSLAHRSERPDLAVIAGDGAETEVEEALAILAAATPLNARLRGLVRVGERRWDLVLNRGQRIQLPANQPVPALERVLALDKITPHGMLDRDLAVVDMRLPDRPTIRMNDNAVTELRKIKAEELGVRAK
ncbi:cell division protein FtsQ/DivIB [Marinovum sp. 2_MG-2023]|uniref:cell division protein FtsQ/DivIB n=1 Tax=unclassified Marinovum TaxID=2647166 RepID=UPI0026E21912|nr:MULTISPECIES: cell division protein FtsQ/DivIB [unclassified Marinovum]MDO6731399.1 cell division protein FtsQ/DivIB [Marinovum sp. 2_MG-2023]MDO6780702.1 cell division protein FtsQ/DivIB [Marinovum sp. 1_MG-2023]